MSTTILYQFIPPTLLLLLLILATLATLVTPMRIHRPWTTKQWCSSVTSPAFPHAYSKHSLQTSEIKSRVSSSLQDNRHTCTVAGVQSRCHICEDIKCGDDLNQTCNYQLQGVAVGEMSVNIPSVTDIPFAVGGTHRYDYGGGSHVCLHLTADMCSDHTRTNPHTGVTDDYSDCELRCWGHSYPRDSSVVPSVSGATPSPILEMSTYYPNFDNTGVPDVPWLLPHPTSSWNYPHNLPGEAPVNPFTGTPLTYNPQGYVYTHSGGGATGTESGFVNGDSSSARFNHPEGVAVDDDGYVYVADTDNHAIRFVKPDGSVETIAGTGTPGYVNTAAGDPQFSSPSGIAIHYDWQWWGYTDDAVDPDLTLYENGLGRIKIFVADTNNHCIRLITLDLDTTDGNGYKKPTNVVVTCFSGRCGDGTDSFTDSTTPDTREPGYADGEPYEARFNSPRGVTVSDIGSVLVADTNNHLIRVIQRNGTAHTLAGSLEVAETDADGNAMPGCPPPCLKGVPGYRDGNLTYAQFFYPSSVNINYNNTALSDHPDDQSRSSVFVTDKHKVRRVHFAVDSYDDEYKDQYPVSHIQGVKSHGRVVTIAGVDEAGQRDGTGPESSFNSPTGIAVTSDGNVYVTDTVTCRIRRLTPADVVSAPASCVATVNSMIRPDGCASFNEPVDETSLKISPSQGNTYYNYDMRDYYDVEWGEDYVGRMTKDCVGTPPPDKLDKKFWNVTSPAYPYNENLVIDDHIKDIREDPNEGTTIKISCPALCSASSVYGGPYYSTESSVCSAAVHAGAITASDGGLVTVTLQRGVNARDPAKVTTTTANGITSLPLTSNAANPRRLFTVALYPLSSVEVQTIAGSPAGLLENQCGKKDAMPPLTSLFSNPTGVAAALNRSLTDSTLLYVADRNNHAIRAVSATCSFVCENMGSCVGPDICQCQPGWEGLDCTRPVCASSCATNELCTGPTAPDECTCKPGYSGLSCDKALCVQECGNGGACEAPDTCGCTLGWIDSNCTTPVCTQTCGNRGNCTSPDTCSCPYDWTGPDCRVPVCDQTCENGAFCVAPNTCDCPPQWSGHDCSLPVCHQGFFRPNPSKAEAADLTFPTFWNEYKSCNVSDWCESTDTFDCLQQDRLFDPTEIPFGVYERWKTGRKEKGEKGASGCTFIELGENIHSPFPYVNAADQSTTPYHRHTPKTPYEYLSSPRLPHNAFIAPTDYQTQPWKYTMDRQVAAVEWVNTTQGVYVCANGGNCTAPDVCVCAPGWIGFDCRTPVCTQGYYEEPEVQNQFIRGTNLDSELQYFEPFLGENNYRLDPNSLGGEGYSNPNFTVYWETYLNKTHKVRYPVNHKGMPYLAQGSDVADPSNQQGGYSCSVRSVTQWEDYRSGFILEHPNYFSRYMDRKVEGDFNMYSNWTGMEWPPVHWKSHRQEYKGGQLKQNQGQVSYNSEGLPSQKVTVSTLNMDKKEVFYTYTDQGYRRDGDWTLMGNNWTKGTCIMEFNRTCPGKPEKAFDLEAGLPVKEHGLFVQDTDLAFRPRITYDDEKAHAFGRWFQEGGECVDQVVRGCYNNGTCVAPDTCECSPGWSGYDCTVPICEQTCAHNGNCTLPDTCTCEKGWEGHDCSIAVCAQECNNFGECVAPDTCKCTQWPNVFYDGFEGGGRPNFRKSNGDAQMTGWTGYDCSVPICVQAERFKLNVNQDGLTDEQITNAMTELGGHGKDGKLVCTDVRCHAYNAMVTQNDGTSFQTGCGYDPIDTGCCDAVDPNIDVNENGEAIFGELVHFVCHECRPEFRERTPHNVTCRGMIIDSFRYDSTEDVEERFKVGRDDPAGNDPNMCGRNHNPGGPMGVDEDGNPTNNEYYVTYLADVGPEYSSQNGMSNLTSDTFLCNRYFWEQGDFIDDAGLGELEGMGTDFGLQSGRHVRVNYPNYIKKVDEHGFAVTDELGYDIWDTGPTITGEGIFECYNGGSCLGPDQCSCKDGWAGPDCNEPLCRHMQADSSIVGCLNGGVCSNKDDCTCIQTVSVLWKKYEEAQRGLTGWTGTDCSMPVCMQGYYDPFCKMDAAPGGEGCYRCANDGLCTGPDYCQCAKGWTGYDCRTPVCEVVSDFLIRKQLATIDEEKVHTFETDPCSLSDIYKPTVVEGGEYYSGNCTLPNMCTCHCFAAYSPDMCTVMENDACDAPWQDLDLYMVRNVLAPNEMFGSRDCSRGYEGIVDTKNRYMSCHMTIVEGSWVNKNTFDLLLWISLGSMFLTGAWIYLRRRYKRKLVLSKIERRKSRRSSEESVTGADNSAFTY